MADFTQKTINKTAERVLTSPIVDVAAFNTLIAGILTDNPWSCTEYTEAGVTYDGVTKSKEYFTGVVNYQNTEAKVIGKISVNAPSSAAFATDISTILATAALTTAMGGTPAHDSSDDGFYTAIRAHFANGEIVSVIFRRSSVTVSGYSADSILTTIETWADGVTALA